MGHPLSLSATVPCSPLTVLCPPLARSLACHHALSAPLSLSAPHRPAAVWSVRRPSAARPPCASSPRARSSPSRCTRPLEPPPRRGGPPRALAASCAARAAPARRAAARGCRPAGVSAQRSSQWRPVWRGRGCALVRQCEGERERERERDARRSLARRQGISAVVPHRPSAHAPSWSCVW